MKRILIVIAVLIFSGAIKAQEVQINTVKMKFSGYIKNDFFYDTRQVVAAREGEFLLWPEPVVKDPDGVDINSVPNFNFLSIQSRVRLDVSGIRVLKADATGKLEADFFGNLNPNINLMRLRLAYINLKWKHNELRFGQDWNPMFITDCFPGTVSFNTGTPIQPFGRSPQIKFTQYLGSFKLIAAVVAQRDHTDRGPDGATGIYLRNSAAPEFSLQIHFKKENQEKGTHFIAGAGLTYKEVRPQIETDSGYHTDAGVSGMSAIAFMKYKAKKITFKLEGAYGQNITNNLSISGYVVSQYENPAKGIVKYSPMQTMSFWTDIHSNGKSWQFGLFAGYTENMGALENMADADAQVYGLATNIANLYRVSPRVIYNVSKIRFALEFEYTVANYGAKRDPNGRPIDLTPATNLRTLFAIYYFF